MEKQSSEPTVQSQRSQSQRSRPPLAGSEPASVSPAATAAAESPVAAALQAAAADGRVLLLAPHGPLIIDLRVTVDGHPLSEPREELIDELLQLADRNHDGRATWGEVFADPRRVFGLLRTDVLHLAHRRDFMKANDTNRNGLVDRDEARRFIAAAKSAGASLSIENAADFYASAARQSIVRKLLDADGDGALDRGERMALERRLLSRDANNDRIVMWSELDDSLAGDELADERQKLKHRDDRLSAQELRGHDSLEPDAIIGVAFQESEQAAAGRLTLEALSSRLTRIGAPVAGQISLASRSPGLRLRLVLDDRRAGGLAGVYAIVLRELDAVFSIIDANHDGRLTTRELRGGSVALDDCDADGDGRVAIEEIPAEFVIVLGRGRPPEKPLLVGTFSPGRGADLAPEWFRYMDGNGDMEVDRDEFPGGNERFRALDADGDGFITHAEARQAVSEPRRK
ncbi:MAG TPA: hypothetical protein VF278_16245 [Pirellulales bacterium]